MEMGDRANEVVGELAREAMGGRGREGGSG